MFPDDLYTIVSLWSTSEKISSRIRLNAGHHLYNGHFPGSPITPGVVQVQIVQEIMEGFFQGQLRLDTMRSCKFLAILNPRDTPEVDFEISYQKSEKLEITAYAENEGVTFFKMQATFL